MAGSWQETFDKTDGVGLGPDLTWDEVDDGSGFVWRTRSNQAQVDQNDLTSANSRGSASVDVAGSADHFAEVVFLGFSHSATVNVGPAARVNPAMTHTRQTNADYYTLVYEESYSTRLLILRKSVNGTLTNLASLDMGQLSSGDVLRIEVDGSTVRGLVNGALPDPAYEVTDTDITGHTRTGLAAYISGTTGTGTGQIVLDNFATGALAQDTAVAGTFESATVAAAGQDLTGTAGAVSGTYEAATVAADGADATVAIAPVAGTFEPATVALVGQGFAGTVGPVAGTFDPATLDTTATDLTATVGGGAATFTAATITTAGQDLTASLGTVSGTFDASSVATTADDLTGTVGTASTFDPAPLTATASDVSATVGAVAGQLEAAALTFAAQQLQAALGALTGMFDPASLTVTARDATVEQGVAVGTFTASTLTPTAQAMVATAGGVSGQFIAGLVALTARDPIAVAGLLGVPVKGPTRVAGDQPPNTVTGTSGRTSVQGG